MISQPHVGRTRSAFDDHPTAGPRRARAGRRPQEPPQGLDQNGELGIEELPDQGVVHGRVAADQDVAERDDARQLRDLSRKPLVGPRQLVAGFAMPSNCRSTAERSIASLW